MTLSSQLIQLLRELEQAGLDVEWARDLVRDSVEQPSLRTWRKPRDEAGRLPCRAPRHVGCRGVRIGDEGAACQFSNPGGRRTWFIADSRPNGLLLPR